MLIRRWLSRLEARRLARRIRRLFHGRVCPICGSDQVLWGTLGDDTTLHGRCTECGHYFEHIA